MISHLSPTSLPLVFSHYILDSLRAWFKCVSHLSPLVSHLCPSAFWMLWVLESAWFRTCFPRVSELSRTTLCILCPHDIRLVSHFFPLVSQYTPLWPTWFRISLPLVSTCLALVSQFALDALSALVRMILHLSPSCVPLHSGLSARMISHWSPSYLPVRFALLRMILHLFPTCVHCVVCGTTTTNHLQPVLAQTSNAMYKKTVWICLGSTLVYFVFEFESFSVFQNELFARKMRANLWVLVCMRQRVLLPAAARPLTTLTCLLDMSFLFTTWTYLLDSQNCLTAWLDVILHLASSTAIVSISLKNVG